MGSLGEVEGASNKAYNKNNTDLWGAVFRDNLFGTSPQEEFGIHSNSLGLWMEALFSREGRGACEGLSLCCDLPQSVRLVKKFASKPISRRLGVEKDRVF